MTTRCGYAGGQCPNAGTTLVRIAMVGDRTLCAEHLAWMGSMGMAVRVLEPDTNVPEWRTRSLARAFDRGPA